MGIIKVRTKTPLVARGPGPVFDDDIEEEDKLGRLWMYLTIFRKNRVTNLQRFWLPLVVFYGVSVWTHKFVTFAVNRSNWNIKYLWNFSPSVSDEAQEAEAVQVLNAILDIREHTPSDPVEIIKILHALAMLQFVFKNLSLVSSKGQ